ncbi:MAG: AzlC family ABC transporter permease [Tissierellia bacterium]|nr:AzlC family ABC transporter permease [Tissierellia bacterium]
MKDFKYALTLSTPVLISYIFIGLAAGLLFHPYDHALLYAFLSSLLIYSGSIQIILIPLLMSGASYFTLGITALLIGSRHIFYGFSFLDRYPSIGGWKFPYMALTMTDETYSILATLDCPQELDQESVHFFVLFLCHSIWIISTVAGAFLGEFLPWNLQGIDFAATALFALIVYQQGQISANHWPIFIGFGLAISFLIVLGPDRFILPSLLLTAAILYPRRNES